MVVGIAWTTESTVTILARSRSPCKRDLDSHLNPGCSAQQSTISVLSQQIQHSPKLMEWSLAVKTCENCFALPWQCKGLSQERSPSLWQLRLIRSLQMVKEFTWKSNKPMLMPSTMRSRIPWKLSELKHSHYFEAWHTMPKNVAHAAYSGLQHSYRDTNGPSCWELFDIICISHPCRMAIYDGLGDFKQRCLLEKRLCQDRNDVSIWVCLKIG